MNCYENIDSCSKLSWDIEGESNSENKNLKRKYVFELMNDLPKTEIDIKELASKNKKRYLQSWWPFKTFQSIDTLSI